MSWLGRLFGGEPKPVPNSVVIPDDLATRLTAENADLQTATVAALQTHFAAIDNPKPAVEAAFWLERGGANSEIEDELRDRVTARIAEEQK